MNLILRHLLLPVTLFAYYYIVFICLYWTTLGLLWIFDLKLIWILLFETVLIGFISAISSYPSIIINLLLYKLYNYSWLSVILHSVAGALGFIVYYLYLREDTNIRLSVFWDISKIKTILLILPFAGVIIGAFYSFVLSGVLMKLDKKDSDY